MVLCDDDAHLRVVLRGTVHERGHEVVGEAETADDSKQLVATARPELVIIDIALRQGSGADVGRMAAAQGCRVIVFSAFLDSISDTEFADAVVAKPDFYALEAAIDALTMRTASGEQWNRGQPDRRASTVDSTRPLPPSAIEQPDSFYRALDAAQPGDSLILIDAPGPDAAESLAIAARGVIRPHDHLMLRGPQVALLLVAGSADAPTAVAARLTTATEGTPYGSGWTWRSCQLTGDESPAEAYQQLRQR